MLDGTSTLPPHLSDEFYWYAPDALVLEAQVNADGVWRATSREADPNGVLGFRLDLVGPEAPAVPGGVALRYGYNRFTVRTDSGAPQDGGTIYVGDPGGWVDLYDPAVYSAIVTGTASPDAVVPTPYPFAVQAALTVATGILASLTAGMIHPAGRAVDEFRCGRTAHRLSLQHRPVTEVASVAWLPVSAPGETVPLTAGLWRLRGSAVMVSAWGALSNAYGLRGGEDFCAPEAQAYRVTYRFGSTISPAARAALLYLSRQHYLRGTGKNCELPSRTSSVNREGVSITIDVEQSYLDKGLTGVGSVDQWLSTLTLGGRRRGRSGVFTDDSPPPVTVEYVASL